jgi:hypothetical protein
MWSVTKIIVKILYVNESVIETIFIFVVIERGCILRFVICQENIYLCQETHYVNQYYYECTYN